MKRDYGKYKLLCFFILVALFFSTQITSIHSEDKPKNVLILNSYHEGLSWTDKQTEGILDTLKAHSIDYNISVEYMDWKNYPTDENLEQMYKHLGYKYSHRQLDIVITTDDVALSFALKNRTELFNDAPVVFCGVNEQGIKELTKGYSRTTGVAEIIDPENTVKAALEMNPELKEIYLLFDNSESGLSTGEMTMQAIKSIRPDIKIKAMNKLSTEDVLAEVAKAPDDSAVLITTYYMDPKGLIVGFEEFTHKVSQSSRVPVFHLYAFGIDNGAIGGSMLSGRLQGESAGKIAARVLEGEDISQIPFDVSKTTRYIFDYKELMRFGIPLDKVPQGSEIVNKPFSFLEAYKNIVVTVGIIIILLIAFILILVFYLGKISKMKSKLQENHQELIQSESKLKRQYEELVRVQRSLVSSEKRYSLLFDTMLNGFFVLEPVMNKEGKLVDIRFLNMNPGFRLQIGVETDDIIGRTWTEVFNYSNQNLKIYESILRTGEPKHFETYYENTDIYYLVNAFKISDTQVGVIFDNITVYKKAIKEITLLNEELEQRVAERTEELQSAVNELEAFTYTVSHDLKSPLRAVDGYSRIIIEDFGIRLGDEGNEIINNIRNICKDMLEMISKLLKYSTMSKTAMVKEAINIEEIFKAVFNELKSLHTDRDIRLIVETGLPVIYADRVMLRQVVYNILSNAVKFTKHRETAFITVGCTITGEEYVFYVRDNGVGFDMNYSAKLFGIFQRLHTSDEFEGSGIGLVTIKKIIQKHGGQVRIEGTPEEGATIYFTFPFKQ